MERLIVSGSTGPHGEGSEETAIAWVLDRLGLDDAARSGASGPIEVERGGATVLLRVDRGQRETPSAVPSAEPEPIVTGAGQLALFEGSGEALPSRAPKLRELTVVPEPPLHRVTRLSFSALSLFERCSYRYYAERVAGMRPAAWSGEGRGGVLHPTEIGDAVHRLLERVDLAQPQPPDDLRELVHAWYPTVMGADLEHVARLVSAYCESTLARRIGTLRGVRLERPFAFALDGVLLNGRLDVLWRDGDRALVLDYKTNVLDGREPSDVVESEYRTQRDVYALACLRAGVSEVEIAYQFLEAPEDVVSATFSRSQVDALEQELRAAIARITSGDFRPSPSPFACAGCPALDRVCAGPGLPSPDHGPTADLAAHA
jgi:hypothetical protein